MKAQKKPVIIDYIPFEYWNLTEIEKFCEGNLITEQREGIGACGHFINTLEGHSYLLSPQDVIIKGVNGEFYPCKKDIFEKTYDKID